MTELDSFDPLRSSAPLIIYIDFKSPYAFVAKDPTYALSTTLGIEVDWRPLTLDIPSYLGSARLDKTGRVVESHRTPEQWTGVKYAYKDGRRYADLQGYRLRGTEKIWDTSLAHIALWWVKAQGPRLLRSFCDDVYERFWRRELDLEDMDVVEAAIARAGAGIDGFRDYAGGPGRVEHDSMQERIFEAGIFCVPCFIVEEELFFGREHLPMIRWVLEGRRGPQPDIAYQRLQESPQESPQERLPEESP